MNFAEPFIRRPVATTLLVTTILIFGVLGYRLLPVSDLPSVDYPTIQVQASLPGAAVSGRMSVANVSVWLLAKNCKMDTGDGKLKPFDPVYFHAGQTVEVTGDVGVLQHPILFAVRVRLLRRNRARHVTRGRLLRLVELAGHRVRLPPLDQRAHRRLGHARRRHGRHQPDQPDRPRQPQ